MTGNEKARKWLAGRKDIFNHIASSLKPGEKRIWFHCASLGEFEQGRPVMEELRIKDPGCRIVLTFFSPSGYEVRKNYKGADYIFYLPIDTASNAKRFVELIQPEKVFFVKYEFWHHYFKTIKQQGIPLYIISAIFRKDQSFFKWYGGFFRSILKCVNHFFVQDDSSKQLLQSIGLINCTVAGDTRFDRVSAIAADAKQIPVVEKFKNGKKLFIAGSTWPQDEELITKLIGSKPSLFEKYLIAPHEIGGNRIQALVEKLSTEISSDKIVLFSKADESILAAATVLIIDNYGMLSSLYRYAEMAYIGGGFGIAVHNTVEAAVFGMPVFFGPNYHKFREAKELIACGGGFSINSYAELQSKMQELINDESKWNTSSALSHNYVKSKTGATAAILKVIS